LLISVVVFIFHTSFLFIEPFSFKIFPSYAKAHDETDESDTTENAKG